MRKPVPAHTLFVLLLAALSICLFGCEEKKEDKGELTSTAPINNNAPEAKSAPVAPRDPSIPMPGGNGGGKKGAPPPGGKQQ